eukprot:TRINITY_DN25013_c0_g1_i1.p1 TRINITY_DN25013_c0_g1~~TRINITY_DN25013_c0_g1_i1.p1  ORF type:complete len:279 (+),score=24.16 TRINITY_DN25013_c0_g1_i1:120-956(+)
MIQELEAGFKPMAEKNLGGDLQAKEGDTSRAVRKQGAFHVVQSQSTVISNDAYPSCSLHNLDIRSKLIRNGSSKIQFPFGTHPSNDEQTSGYRNSLEKPIPLRELVKKNSGDNEDRSEKNAFQSKDYVGRTGFRKYSRDKSEQSLDCSEMLRHKEDGPTRMSEDHHSNSFSPFIYSAAQIAFATRLLNLISPQWTGYSEGSMQFEMPSISLPCVRAIGCYTKQQRQEKILRYKSKISKWKENHPIRLHFKGRSRVAMAKPRVKGRFVKANDRPMPLSN